jgi:RNA polymerase sigma-70 factor (ECF subfamily)
LSLTVEIVRESTIIWGGSSDDSPPDLAAPFVVLAYVGHNESWEGAPLVRTAWTDEELVARSVDGDVDSFNQLILRWERPIYALAYRTIGREEEARDIVQDTFLRAYRALPGFKGQAKFSSWLYRIALNLCRDWIRKQRRTPTVQTPDGVDLIELASEQGPVESIEELVSRREMSAAVAAAMTHLPEEQRTAIVLKEYHGLTFQEIADLQGCPLSTVKTRLYQGLSVLRRHLEASGMTSAAGASETSEKAS